MDRWRGRVALVTGASGGIGEVICEDLMDRGMIVLGVGSRNPDVNGESPIEQLSARLNAKQNCTGKFFAYKCDLTNEADIRALYADFLEEGRKIQLCINSAVVMKNSSLVNGATDDWVEMLKVNVLGLCINTSMAVKKMLELIEKKEIDEGQVIQMCGIVGHKIPSLIGKPPGTPRADLYFYEGTKFMVRGLTEGLRRELTDVDLKEFGEKIRVSAISPGSVQTKLLEKATSKAEADAYFGTYKCLEPKDVAAAVRYILETPTYLNVHDIIMEPVKFQV